MEFEITFDYLCPFARNAHEAVVAGLAAGKDWRPRFRPFSLSQVHSEAEVFADHAQPGVRALQWGIAVRDADPDHFLPAHLALFSARHDEGLDLGDEEVLRRALMGVEVDLEAVESYVEEGKAAETLAAEHTEAVERWGVFGVPTLIRHDLATFVRLMSRGDVGDLERVLSLLDWRELNEFKRARLDR